MLHLLEHTPAAPNAVSASHLPVMLDTYQQDRLTGIVQLTWAADARAFLLFVDGTIMDTYLFTGEMRLEISPSDLPAHMPAGTLTMRSLALPHEGVRAMMSLLEWYPATEMVNVETGDVEGRLSVWSAQTADSVVHLTWPDAEGLVLLRGNKPPDQVVFLTNRQIERGTAALIGIYNHRGGPCTLARYVAPFSVAAPYRDVPFLRTTFNSLVNTVIQRYTELVGSHMGRALILDLDAHAHAGRWNVGIIGSGIEVQAPDDLESAMQVYRSFLSDLIEHMSIVIGKRLAGVLILESSTQLGSAAQKVIQDYALIPADTIHSDLYGRHER